MKIAYVTETWLPYRDGVVTRLTSTIRTLLAAGHEILVVAPEMDGVDPDWPGLTVRTVPAVGWEFLYGGKKWGLPLPRVSRYLDEFDPDVVHVVNPVLLGAAGIRAARRRHCGLVASYHTDIARYAAWYRLGWLRPVIWARLRQLHGHAHVNLATSAAARAQLMSHGITGVHHWPRGVDLDRFHPARLPVAPVEGAAPRQPVALYVGRLAAEKGLPRLAGVAAPDSGFDLMLVGDGPARAELTRALPAIFTGELDGERLAAAYRQADVFVFPSDTETLGLVLLEALASGLPVVAVDSLASRETLTGCAAARLCPADQPDRLAELARELVASAPRDELARLARAHAAQWGWDTATARLRGYYQQAMDAARWERPAPAMGPGPEHQDIARPARFVP